MKFVLTVLLTLGSGAAFAATTTGKTAAATTPHGFVLVEEDVSLNWHAMPLDLMEESVLDLNDKNVGEAAGDLKAAARVLRASRDLSKEAKVSADNLDLIARKLKSGDVSTVPALKAELAQVAYYNSIALRRRASSEFGQRKLKEAGYDLDAAASSLERSILWSGKARSSDTDASVRDGHVVASKLVDGTGWKENDVTTAFSELTTTTDLVGSQVLPKASRAAESPSSL